LKSIVPKAALPVLLLVLLAAPGCKKGGDAPHPSEPQGGKTAQEPYYYGLIEEYRSVLAGDPHNLAAIIGLGNAFYDAGQWKEAIRYYEQSILIDPSNADVVTDMATCYRNLGMPDRAIADYRKALLIEPTHQNALYNLGVVYGYDNNDYESAVRIWERLLVIAPKHPKADTIRAGIANFRRLLARKAR